MYGLPRDRMLPGMTAAELWRSRIHTWALDLDPEGTFARLEKVIRGAKAGSYTQN